MDSNVTFTDINNKIDVVVLKDDITNIFVPPVTMEIIKYKENAIKSANRITERTNVLV